MTQQSNAERRARGLRRLEVWLPQWILDRLDRLVLAEGYESRAEAVKDLIERTGEER